jgi:hypothetical protein
MNTKTVEEAWHQYTRDGGKNLPPYEFFKAGFEFRDKFETNTTNEEKVDIISRTLYSIFYKDGSLQQQGTCWAILRALNLERK